MSKTYGDNEREERHSTLKEGYMQNQRHYEYEVLGNADKFILGWKVHRGKVPGADMGKVD